METDWVLIGLLTIAAGGLIFLLIDVAPYISKKAWIITGSIVAVVFIVSMTLFGAEIRCAIDGGEIARSAAGPEACYDWRGRPMWFK